MTDANATGARQQPSGWKRMFLDDEGKFFFDAGDGSNCLSGLGISRHSGSIP